MKLVFENKKRMNEDFHDGYNYVTKCSFDFANNGKYEEDWIRDHIDKVMDQMGCDWSGYLEFENVTEAYK